MEKVCDVHKNTKNFLKKCYGILYNDIKHFKDLGIT